MSEKLHSIWPVLTLDGVGDAIGDARPTFVVSRDGRFVHFANAAGARFLGLAADRALDARLGLEPRLADRLARFAAASRVGDTGRDLVRFFDGLRSTLLSIGFRRAADDAVLVTVDNARLDPADADAGASLAAIAAEGGLVALFDADGEVLVARGDHTVLDGVQEAVEAALDADDETAVFERRVAVDGRAHDLALIRLGDGPAPRRLLRVGPAVAMARDEAPADVPVAAEPAPLPDLAPAAIVDAPRAETTTDDAPIAATEPTAAAETTAAPEAPAEAIEPPPALLLDRNADLPDAATADAAALVAPEVEPETTAVEVPEVAPEREPEATTGEPALVTAEPVPEATTGALVSSDAPAVPEPEPAPEPDAARPADGFVFNPVGRAVKFVWQMDAERRFTLLSGELADVVGPRAADVVGRRWSEIAERLGLDAEGRVAAALERRDTWSGRTVLWPIEGEALRLPVDLAALPAFDRGRVFTGYRGFGTIRAEEPIPDPTATGLRLAARIDAEPPATETAPAGIVAEAAEPVAAAAVDLPAAAVAATAVAAAAVDFTASEATDAEATVAEVAARVSPEVADLAAPDAEDRPSALLATSEAAAPAAPTPIAPTAPTPIAPAAVAPSEASLDAGRDQPTSLALDAEPIADPWLDDELALAMATLPACDEPEPTPAPAPDVAISPDTAISPEALSVEAGEPTAAEAQPATTIAEPQPATPAAEPRLDRAPPLSPLALAAIDLDDDLAETEATDATDTSAEADDAGDDDLLDDLAAAPSTLRHLVADVGERAASHEPRIILPTRTPHPPAPEPSPVDATADEAPAPSPVAHLADAAAPAAEPVDTMAPVVEPVEPTASAPEPAAAVPARIVSLVAPLAAPPATTRLSPPERVAFRQIAEALGARLEGDEVDAPLAEPASAGTLPAAPAAPVAAPVAIDSRLLDRLPGAVAVVKDDSLVYGNDAFLRLLAYPDLATLAAEGGLDALFAGEHVARRWDAAPDGSRPVPVLARDGRVIPVDATVATVPWAGASALMLTLTEVSPTTATVPEPAIEPEAQPEPEAMPPAPIAATPAPAPTLALALAAPVETAGDPAGRERVAELEAIIDTATDGVLMLDADGMVLSANHAAEALFGTDRRDMIGRPLADRLAPESRRSAMDYLDGLARNGVASVLNDGREVIGTVEQGGLIPLFMTIGRISAEPSRKYCAVLRDITQWKKSEEDLTAARRRAEEASVHKSDFLAKISHEIRTPLNAIIGFSEVMMDERFGPIGNDRYKDYLRDIHSSGSHIMSLINDLLDLSKVEAGKMDLRFEAVTLADIVAECVAMMQPQANRERIIIRSSLPAGVPPVVADPRSVRQVVLNLLSNAIKFTPSGGQVIVSTTLEDNGEVVMRVRDTGYGMTDKELQTAMEPFRQLHTTRSRGGGTGLGLPLTKALVEANRAVFRIDSTVGQGTLVTVTFPVTRVLAS